MEAGAKIYERTPRAPAASTPRGFHFGAGRADAPGGAGGGAAGGVAANGGPFAFATPPAAAAFQCGGNMGPFPGTAPNGDASARS